MAEITPYSRTAQEVTDPQQLAFIASMLTAMGHWDGTIPTAWSQELEDALIQYQVERGLSASGRWDQATQGDFLRVIAHASGGTGMDDTQKYILNNYGPGMIAMLNHPEIGPILRRAADQKATPELLYEWVSDTAWFKRQGESERAWEDLKLNNPGQADSLRRDREALLWDSVRKLGVNADPSLVRDIAEDSLRYSWGEAQLNDVLVGFVTYDPKNPEGSGQLATTISQLKDYARKYFIALPDREVYDRAQRILKGETTLDAQVVEFKQQAKSRFAYGGLDTLIDQGVTPESYFSQHRQDIAGLLEMGVEQIDFMDPKYAAVLGVPDPNGKVRPMTRTEAMDWARKQPEWMKTANAGNAAAEVALQIREVFQGIR